MLRLPLALAGALVVLGACSSPKPAAAPSPAPDGNALLPQAATERLPDIGDVESSIGCELTLAPEHAESGWEVTELRDHRKQLSMVTVTTTGPAKSLQVQCTVKSINTFSMTPVAIRGRLLREITPGAREPIGEFSLVAGAMAHELPARGNGLPPAIWTFDALAGLESVPESMLLTVETTLMQTPAGTDEASLDAATAEVQAAFQTVELSNPLRVNLGGTLAPEPQAAS